MSEQAQFETLSVFVWVFFVAIGITIVRRWEHFHRFEPSFVLPVFHVLPWLVGMIERRTVKKHEELCPQSVIRVLWGAYSSLFAVEAMALWE